MKRFKILFLMLVVLAALLGFWYWTDKQDYFQADYKSRSVAQKDNFIWRDGDDTEKLIQRYRKALADSQYVFPGQSVTKI